MVKVYQALCETLYLYPHFVLKPILWGSCSLVVKIYVLIIMIYFLHYLIICTRNCSWFLLSCFSSTWALRTCWQQNCWKVTYLKKRVFSNVTGKINTSSTEIFWALKKELSPSNNSYYHMEGKAFWNIYPWYNVGVWLPSVHEMFKLRCVDFLDWLMMW